MLSLGRQEVDIVSPLLGRGSFAIVRRGVYRFSWGSVKVAYKIFPDTQQMNRELRKQVRKPARATESCKFSAQICCQFQDSVLNTGICMVRADNSQDSVPES